MEKKKCIVVIEDEASVQQNMVENLIRNDFDVFAYSKAEDAIESEILTVADAVVMDIRLPGINGWQATSIIKKNNAELPVLMVTAYSDVNYRLQGFETGADDYIIKPFFMEELIARLRTILKRYELAPSGKRFYQVGDLNIDIKGKSVFRGKEVIKLSQTEFNLLALLAEGNGLPVSKEEILKKIWKGKYSVSDNTIEVYINLLRNKIDKPFPSKLIHTKPGFGYFLAQEQ
ncbi:response regulator transcription factor [Niastella sp. OAS944]|uniref:response regulator transcription factor n=1 Tax=Niastella sp. OAS944 TaxID=2664089 RepID=UPI00347AE2CC|nr:two-component system copper resistance phosphate regulon response regulator CusR [Chitinophagaceae bacterium OAS944]